MEERRQAVRIELDFAGSGLQFLGWGFLALVLSLFILPAAWGVVPFYAWYVRNLRASDGTTFSFTGAPGEIWYLFAISCFLGFLPQAPEIVSESENAKLAVFLLTLLLMPLQIAVGLVILRWIVARISLSGGPELRFAGSFGGYLGWSVVLFFSWFTIIGWPWAMTAFMRWFCDNIEGRDLIISFEGSGIELLWRGFVALAVSALILPIPWMCVWLLSWFTRKTYLYRPA